MHISAYYVQSRFLVFPYAGSPGGTWHGKRLIRVAGLPMPCFVFGFFLVSPRPGVERKGECWEVPVPLHRSFSLRGRDRRSNSFFFLYLSSQVIFSSCLGLGAYAMPGCQEFGSILPRRLGSPLGGLRCALAFLGIFVSIFSIPADPLSFDSQDFS